ncbi:hypothetical protein [Acinetobacter courvalinii]|uniref:hypothetical protein n=1 Tax=Acinetobacter courvalinii TaxID=280147 RepID=UPI0028A22F18|nr:hypothetical protein [Acinetobacter courvalinii]
MSWTVYRFHDSVQVVPDDDLKPHTFFHCECHPDFKDGIFIHYSFDGREHYETPLPS